MRLHRLSTIAFWPCRVLLIVFLVCVKVFGLEHHSNETRPSYSAMEINRTEDYQVGYAGSDPFADQLGGTTTLSHRGKRKKRSAVHLYNMVSCATGCDPLLYKGYGCYCGFLGSGYTVDGIDRCCQMHDWCYDSSGCPMFLEYFVPYLWKCYHRQPLCGIDLDSPGSCGQRLCHCDQLLAQCLRKYPCPTTKALCTSSPWRLLQNVLML